MNSALLRRVGTSSGLGRSLLRSRRLDHSRGAVLLLPSYRASSPSSLRATLWVLHGGLGDDERGGTHVLKKSDLYSSLWKSCDSRSLFTKVDRAHVFPDHMAPLTTEAGA